MSLTRCCSESRARQRRRVRSRCQFEALLVLLELLVLLKHVLLLLMRVWLLLVPRVGRDEVEGACWG